MFNVTKYKNIIFGISDLNDIKSDETEINLFKDELIKCESIKSKNEKRTVINIISEFF